MTDYIKREDALNQFDYYDLDEYYTPQIAAIIEDIPSADVAPVRHGEWKFDNETDSFFCSECNAEALLKYIVCGGCIQELSEYCPNCGARMDSEEKNCDTCKHYDKGWDDIICDGCTKAHSNWERKDDE